MVNDQDFPKLTGGTRQRRDWTTSNTVLINLFFIKVCFIWINIWFGFCYIKWCWLAKMFGDSFIFVGCFFPFKSLNWYYLIQILNLVSEFIPNHYSFLLVIWFKSNKLSFFKLVLYTFNILLILLTVDLSFVIIFFLLLCKEIKLLIKNIYSNQELSIISLF